MKDHYKIIAENPESTVVADYQSEYKRATSYQSEAELEKAFVKLLEEQAYTFLPIRTEDDLVNNLRSQLEQLNNYSFTDKEWKDFLENLRAAPLLEKLAEVNEYLNRYPYVDDIVNWGFDNYWETPYEFLARNGDCEDFFHDVSFRV